jgi:flagella basal body P-ring formation protein FlgA
MVLGADDLSGDYRPQDFIGKELIRSVRAGAPLNVRNVRKPHLVKRNETVTLVFRRGPLVMETLGRSLGQGAEGERIALWITLAALFGLGQFLLVAYLRSKSRK